MIRFDHPELAWLAPPILWVLLRFSPRVPFVRVLRTVVALLLVAILAGPRFDRPAQGNDVIVVVDRSRSMPSDATTAATESIRLLERAMGTGDRLAVISFGSEARVVQSPVAESKFGGTFGDVEVDGSDLAGAIEQALALVPVGRAAALLVLSDGESRGRDPIVGARRAAARGIPIHVRPVLRSSTSDVAVERLDLPGKVSAAEPFQFSAWVHSDLSQRVTFTLTRDGIVIARGERDLEPGRNRLVFRDRVDEESIPRYRLEVSAPENADRVKENSAANGALRVSGSARVLVLNHDGSRSRLVTILEGGGIGVEAKRPEDARLDSLSLGRYRAVFLENVAASRLGKGMDALAEFVSTRGGGLVMTGGRASFGVGGYYRSALDPVLPVSMELRQEMRKMAIAVAFALDRSGSMSAPAGSGRTKMDLANAGTVAAIEMLSPMDSVAVLAIDSSAHPVVRMQPVEDVLGISDDVLRIQSMGGGIFTFTALEAAGDEVLTASQANRHIVLFADAADAEEHGGCLELIEKLRGVGVTLSVIALGSRSDSDGEFLVEIAEAGGGEAHFVSDVSDLPRVFSHDIMTVARSSFIEGEIGTAVLPDLLGLGANTTANFPPLRAYNLTYLRQKALAGVATTDEWKAPIVAFHYHGLGRAAAITTPISESFLDWSGASDFLVTLARFAIGQETPAAYFGAVRREGGEAVIRVEVDRDLDPRAAPPREARVRDASGGVRTVILERVGADRAEARVPLLGDGVVLGAVDLGDHRVLELPPVALPYSPEFERSADPRRGERLLSRIAAESGGGVVATLAPLFESSGRAIEAAPIGREIAFLALLIFLLELIERRFGVCARAFALLRMPRRFRTADASARGLSAPGKPEAVRDVVSGGSERVEGAPARDRIRTVSVEEKKVEPPGPGPSAAAAPTDAAALARGIKKRHKR